MHSWTLHLTVQVLVIVFSGSHATVTISVAPWNLVTLGTPMNLTCSFDTSNLPVNVTLTWASNTASVPVALCNVTASSADCILARIQVFEASDGGSTTLVTFAYFYTTATDNGCYQCLVGMTQQSLPLCVDVTAASVAENSSSTANTNSAAGLTSYVEVNPMYAIVISIAAFSTALTMLGLVLLSLRMRYGDNFTTRLQCRIPCWRRAAESTTTTNTGTSTAGSSGNVTDKPPSYDDVVLDVIQPPSYNSLTTST
jgi:hypothetical protein